MHFSNTNRGIAWKCTLFPYKLIYGWPPDRPPQGWVRRRLPAPPPPRVGSGARSTPPPMWDESMDFLLKINEFSSAVGLVTASSKSWPYPWGGGSSKPAVGGWTLPLGGLEVTGRRPAANHILLKNKHFCNTNLGVAWKCTLFQYKPKYCSRMHTFPIQT